MAGFLFGCIIGIYDFYKNMKVYCGSKEVEIDDLAVSFFYVFSRFEYALKRNDYFKGDGKEVVADWDRFGGDLDNNLPLSGVNSEAFKEASNYIFEYSPKKQIVSNKKLDWKELSFDDKNFKNLLILVRRIRNNLFHGGKFPGRPVDGSERNQELLRAGRVIILGCLEFDKKVEHEFYRNE